MKKNKNISIILVFLLVFSISLSSPLDDYNEDIKNDNSSMALHTPVNKKEFNDNTLFVIHIDVGNRERLDSYQYEDNTVLRGLERGINSYVNILNNIRNRKAPFFRRD